MKKITMIFVVSIIVVIALYDAYAIINGGTEASVSFLLIKWSYEFPAFTFLMGFTMGHLFWKIRPVKKELK